MLDSTHDIQRSEMADPCFAFVIPVRNPLDEKVKDYRTIESLLRMTISSLLRQTHPNVAVVVVCHGAPEWSTEFDDRVRFLNVSNDDVFGPDQHATTIDKGMRFTVGTLYAADTFDPELIMLLDADDYANVRLAEHLLPLHAAGNDVDCYMIHRGVHAGVQVGHDYVTRYRYAVEVEEFDFTCGSCRVFDTASLLESLTSIDAVIRDRFGGWAEADERGCVIVHPDPLEWLLRSVESAKEDRDHIINVLGRHTRQRRAFSVRYVDIVGAAKGCGHGNHNGPRAGAVHWHRAKRNMGVGEFLKTFGLPKQRWSLSVLDRIRARAADRKAGRVWADKYART